MIVIAAFEVCTRSGAHAHDTPPLMKPNNNGNWMSDAEAQKLVDELYYQRAITDVNAVGPDRARGGLYLLLPPGYQGHVPDAYFAFESPTYNVFFHTLLVRGKEGPDTGPAVANAERTRIYPLWKLEKDVKPMVFPNASNKRVNMMDPADFMQSNYLDVDQPVRLAQLGANGSFTLKPHGEDNVSGDWLK